MDKKLSFGKRSEAIPKIAQIRYNQMHFDAFGGIVDFRESKDRDGVKMNI